LDIEALASVLSALAASIGGSEDPSLVSAVESGRRAIWHRARLETIIARIGGHILARRIPHE